MYSPTVPVIIKDDVIDHDEYDQELLALIDRAEDVHSKDNRIAKNDNEKRASEHGDPVCDNLTERRFKDYDVNANMRDAFWRGFLEGLKRSEEMNNETYRSCVDPIHCYERTEKTTKDPYLEEHSHIHLIANNQDVTHKNLSDWEKGKLPSHIEEATVKCLIGSKNNKGTMSISQRDVNMSPKIVPEEKMSHFNISNERLKTKPDEKVLKKTARPLLVMRKTDIHFDHFPSDCTDIELDEEVIKQQATLESPRLKLNTVELSKGSSTFEMSEDSKTRSSHCTVEVEASGSRGAKKYKRALMLTPNVNRPQKMKNSYVNSLDKDMTIFKHSKKQFESSDLCPVPLPSPKKSLRKEGNLDTQENKFALEDIDGWPTKFKPFTDQDNLRLSSSELLHPVDSNDQFEISKMRLKDANLENTSSSKLAKTTEVLKYDNHSEASVLLKPSNKFTAGNSLFLGCDMIDPNARKFETNAFKAQGSKQRRNPFLNDIRNTAELVTIRLTKSSTNSPTCSRNIPISRSQSLQLHKKFLSNINVTKNINLSERLAKQLRDIGQDKGKQRTKDYESLSISTKVDSDIYNQKGKQIGVRKPQHVSETVLSSTHSTNAKRFHENCLTLPNIYASDTRRPTNSTPQDLDESILHPESPVQLPPISGTRLLDSKETSHEENCNEELKTSLNYELNSIRAGNCTSPSTFDKQDPANLKVVATSFPNRIVCATCGGIKEIHKNTEILECHLQEDQNDWEELEVKFDHNHALNSNDTERNPSSKDANAKLIQTKTSSSHEKGRHEKERNSNKKAKYSETCEIKTGSHDKDKNVNIVYKDDNIKLKLQCEVTLIDAKDADNSRKSDNKNNRRINEMAEAKHRERLECPIMKETRIYAQKKKQREDNEDKNKKLEECFSGHITSFSPYLEYCKRREQMRANKQETFHDDMASFLSDTCIADLAESVRKTKRQQLQVIPKRKSSEEFKRKQVNRKKRPSNKYYNKKKKDTDTNVDLEGLIVKPSSLPSTQKK